MPAADLVNHYQTLLHVVEYLNKYYAGMYCMFAFEEVDLSLTIGFRAKKNEAFLKVNLREQAFVFFPQKVTLPRQPRKRFAGLENAKFEEAFAHKDDRSFHIRFEGDKALVFLLYGRNGNALFYEGEELTDSLRKNISTYQDKAFSFFKSLADPAGNAAVAGFDVEETEKGPGLVEGGLPTDEALNKYARTFYKFRKEQQERQREISRLISEKKRLEKSVGSLKLHVEKLGEARNYRKQADLLMANIHQIPYGVEKVMLNDFETGLPVTIKMKKGLNPQAWAERLYQKAKGQQKEREITLGQLRQAESKLGEVTSKLEEVSHGAVLKIRTPDRAAKKQVEKEPPFRSVVFQGYTIYIGKSAANNDELTFRFAHKEDTWLHARGVSGSHVVISHKAKGKEIPKPVLEAAAALAAFNSKAKHSSLVPVAYTLRKFVRKPKGTDPGAVVVEREKVVMVEPRGTI
jgi:predicted ribosome quality control (RQC) complex YloA/Tae2 family protein